MPDLQALATEKLIRGASLPQKMVLRLEGSLEMDMSVFICQAVLPEQDPAVKILPHLCFFFLSRRLLAEVGATLPCCGAAGGPALAVAPAE